MKRFNAVVFALVALLLWGPFAGILAKGLRPTAILALANDADLLVSFAQSFALALVTALLATVTGTLVAFALPGLPSLGRRLTGAGLAFPLVLPEIALALALMVWFLKLGWPFGWGTLLAGHFAFSFSYACLVMKASVETVDPSLAEAARDLGARGVRVFRHALWPQIKPGAIASLLTCFALSLDDFLVSFFTKGLDTVPLPIRIYSTMRVRPTPALYALSVLLFGLSLSAVLLMQIWNVRATSKSSPKPLS